MPLSPFKMSSGKIAKIKQGVLEQVERDDLEEAWRLSQPLLKAARELEAARALSDLTRRGAFAAKNGLVAARALANAHPTDIEVLSNLGRAFEHLHDIRYLNAAPPDDPVLTTIANALSGVVASRVAANNDEELALLNGLGVAARVLGRSWDQVAERSERRLVELRATWQNLYGLGLFYKTRGRFEDGRDANQRAFDSGGAEDESVRWNLGICATGAGDAETALKIWKSMGNKIELGRFGLPEGGYHDVKVRLAQRPLAERNPTLEPDDPGLEETVWAERLSPCHGIVRSALYEELGVDYGDVVLFDGAPITYHEYDGERVAVFPHLSTLQRPGYRIWRFAGTQRQAEQIGDLSKQLPDDALLYVHTEQFHVLCHTCWEAGRVNHDAHRNVEHHVVTGKLCAPPDVAPSALLDQLDRLVAAEAGAVQLLVPELARDVGDEARAEVETRRLAMIDC
jgi:tetratricopeptide (TPR) repeat protein